MLNMKGTKSLTLSEKIDRGKQGRSQVWIVNQMNELLPPDQKITEVQFSRKKKGHDEFTELEQETLSKIIEIEF